MPSPLLGRYALASFAPLVIACATPAGGDEALAPAAAEGASSAALIVLERTVSADDTVHGSAVARFLKMRSGSLDDETLRMVGATLDLPETGSCAASPSGSLALAPSDGPRAVELLDVGSVAFEANGLRTTLEARALPDIVDLVTGVVYSTRTTTLHALDPERSDSLPSRGTYVVRSTGSTRTADPDRAVPAFTVPATAVGEPSELRIDGQDARAPDGVTLSAGTRVDLSWAASGAGDANDTEDAVYVELSSHSSSMKVRCRFEDRGVGSIPAWLLTSLAAQGGAAQGGSAPGGDARADATRGTIVVHRIHREVFQVGGIESGVIRFDFARAAEFTRH